MTNGPRNTETNREALDADTGEWVAPTTATLMILGPTGSGKEMVARSVHEASPRAKGPLVVLDCGATDPGLISSELFGHEPGAFTGATRPHPGVFEQAHGGTIFLDELGEMPVDVQPKLLRVLEGREVRRLGGTKTIPVDVRILCATNRNLEAMIGEGRFREDLYHRLCQVKVMLPPLDERRDDIPVLVADFLRKLSRPERPLSVSDEVLTYLTGRSFPGNVRQLRNLVERVALINRSGIIEMSDLHVLGDLPAAAQQLAPEPSRVAPRPPTPVEEKELILQTLEAYGENLAHTARALGLAINTLKARMRRHGILRKSERRRDHGQPSS